MTAVAEPEAVRTHAEASALTRPPLLILEPLREYLVGTGLLDAAEATGLRWRRIGEGHSNVTFLLEAGTGADAGAGTGARFVLRRGPRPPVPPSTHDMLREARVQRALGRAGVAVPDILAVCDDAAVLGVPFYIMEHLVGDVVTDTLPSWATAPGGRHDAAVVRAGIPSAAIDTLAELHAVDVSRGELAALGRPDGYLRRQVERFASLWSGDRVFPAFDRVAAWLADNLPISARASVVHGDYRIGNLMLRRGAPASVLAVLDWEMATLGDPLADLGYFVATYADADAVPTPLELTSVTRGPGFPRRADLVARYVERTGADVSALAWYETLALWKAAVFCEAIHTRWRAGERPGDAFAASLTAGVPHLLTEALRASSRA